MISFYFFFFFTFYFNLSRFFERIHLEKIGTGLEKWKSEMELLTRNGQTAKQQLLTILIAVIELADAITCNNVVTPSNWFAALQLTVRVTPYFYTAHYFHHSLFSPLIAEFRPTITSISRGNILYIHIDKQHLN